MPIFTTKQAAKLRNCLAPVVKSLIDNPPKGAILKSVAYESHLPHKPFFTFDVLQVKGPVSIKFWSPYSFIGVFPEEVANIIRAIIEKGINQRVLSLLPLFSL